jgi:hypothetical protein
LSEEFSQFGGRPELGDEVKLLEGAGKPIRQAPHGPCLVLDEELPWTKRLFDIIDEIVGIL